MKWRTFLLVTVIALAPNGVSAREQFKIVTAFDRGAFHMIGKDLSKYVAKPADIDLEAVPTRGSAENIHLLRYGPGVKLALVQSDVYQAFQDQAAAGNHQALELVDPLRVITPLYESEVYFITRVDSPLNYIHEIKGSRINIGPLGSGTSMTAATLYRLMFGASLPEEKLSVLRHEEALIKLITDKTIDVVAVTSGQPATLFMEMKPEVKKYIKLLKRDDAAPETKRALSTYRPGTIRRSSYPHWLQEDVPSFVMEVYLVTYDFQTPATKVALSRFAKSLCQNLPKMQREAHEKWQEVRLDTPTLGRGWKYYDATEKEIRACVGAPKGTFEAKVWRHCSVERNALGLCD